MRVKAVSKVGKFSDTACSVISRLVVGIFMPFGFRGSSSYASPCISLAHKYSEGWLVFSSTFNT